MIHAFRALLRRYVACASVLVLLGVVSHAKTNGHSQTPNTFIIDEETPSLCVVALYLYGHCSMHRKIAKWNNIPPPYKIRQGQRLILQKKPTLSPEEGRAKLLWAFRKKFGLLDERPAVVAPPPKLETLSYTELTKLPPPAPKPLPSIEETEETTPAEQEPSALAPAAPILTEAQVRAARLQSTEEQFEEGTKLFNAQSFEKAFATFRSIRTQNPQFLPAWIFEVRSLKALNRDNEARKTAEELIARHPHTKRLQVIQSALDPSEQRP